MSFSEWREYKFSEVMDIIGGGTPKTSISEYWNGEIPWLSVKDFNNDNRTVYETEKSITELGLKNSSTKLLNKGDLIISARGTVGALAQLGKQMAFNQSCYGLRANEITTNDYLYYLLKYKIRNIQQNTHGSVFDTITRDTFDLLVSELPNDIKEQKAIAHIFSTLDEKIEVNNQINKNLEEMVQTIFKHWFVDFEFPNENGEPYKSNGGKMVESELGMIPKGWEVAEIGSFLSVKDGTHASPKGIEHGYPLITSKHLMETRIDFKSAKRISEDDYNEVNKKSKVDRYDILISMIGTVGELYLVQNEKFEFAIKNIGLFKTSEKLELYEYIYSYFKTPLIKQYIKDRMAGSTQQYISLGELRKIPLVLPSDFHLVLEFKKLANPLFDKIYSNSQEIEKLMNSRDTLLPKLMSGEIRVPFNQEG